MRTEWKITFKIKLFMKLEQKKKQLEEVKIKILELQKLRKSLYNHIYITEMREKQKKM